MKKITFRYTERVTQEVEVSVMVPDGAVDDETTANFPADLEAFHEDTFQHVQEKGWDSVVVEENSYSLVKIEKVDPLGKVME